MIHVRASSFKFGMGGRSVEDFEDLDDVLLHYQMFEMSQIQKCFFFEWKTWNFYF